MEPHIQVQWKSFELRPHPVPTHEPNSKYLTSIWRDHVYPLAKKMGFAMKLPPVQPRTRLAHMAAKWAADHGRFDDFNLALFKIFFEEGLDIGSLEVLLKIAGRLGMRANLLEASLIKDVYKTKVLDDAEEARLAEVRAVPAFVVNGQVLAAGMQSVSRLRELISLQ